MCFALAHLACSRVRLIGSKVHKPDGEGWPNNFWACHHHHLFQIPQSRCIAITWTMLFQVKWAATFILSSSYCHHHFHYHHYQDAVAGQMGGNLYIIIIILSSSSSSLSPLSRFKESMVWQVKWAATTTRTPRRDSPRLTWPPPPPLPLHNKPDRYLFFLFYYSSLLSFICFFVYIYPANFFFFSSLLFMFQFLGIRPSMLWWRKEPQEDVKFWPKTLLITLVLSTSL